MLIVQAVSTFDIPFIAIVAGGALGALLVFLVLSFLISFIPFKNLSRKVIFYRAYNSICLIYFLSYFVDTQ